MKIILHLVTGTVVMLLIILFVKDRYQDHELVQRMDDTLEEHAPVILKAEKLYQDVKSSVATASVKESDAKARAWKEWYQAPSDCRKEVLGYDIVECTDHRIDARREFEALWEGKMLQGGPEN